MSAPERMPRAEMLRRLTAMQTHAAVVWRRADADALAEALRELAEDAALLRDVACSGVEDEDPRIDWVSVQVDRDTWAALAPYRATLAGPGAP
jgi:uncharacterized heparinase superfamily protein